MKFMLGHWMMKPSITPLYATEWFRTRCAGERVKLLVPCKHVAKRADTMVAALTVELSSPAEGVIGVTITHHDGQVEKKPCYTLNTNAVDVTIEEDTQALRYRSSGLTATVCKLPNQWGISFDWNGKPLTSTGFHAMAHMTDKESGKVYIQDALEIDVGETVYGLGERFSPLVKNGQAVEMWQGDGGSCSELAYKNVPFYITNRSYGVFVDHPGDVAYEVGSENVERVQFAVEGESLTYYIFGGNNPRDVLMRYTGLLGRPALPPAWSFGLWLSTSFTTEYGEETAASFINGMAKREIPISVFHFDCFWMKGFRWCDFHWDDDTFPEPRAMLKRYKAMNLHICVWINPYIAQDSELFNEGKIHGYLLLRKDGGVWQTDLWQAGMALVDFTNPAACLWYAGKLETLLDDGVDCFKTDFGERVPVRDVRWFDGSDPVRMHNYYTQLYNEIVFNLLESKRGVGEAVVYARSATAGGQKLPVHWGGDNSASYVSMAETLRAGLSLSACGFGFWSHDISGFESTAPADVYKRWCAFGLFSSHSRLHGSSSYRVPWMFDEEACLVLKRFVHLKHQLMPYLFQMAVIAHEQGVPMLRPMVLEFADEPACAYLDRQYMLGESLLVAPVFTKEGTVDYYLPAGVWTHLLDGRKEQGGKWMRDQCDFYTLPVWVRSNTILPIGAQKERPDYDYAHDVTLRIYELEEDGEVTIRIPNTAGQTISTVKARNDGGTIKVNVVGDSQYHVEIC